MSRDPDQGSTFLRHEPCPQCGSRDNLARYSDGHAVCFSFGCGYRERGEGEAHEHHRHTHQPRRPMDLIFDGTEITPIPGRGLTQETTEKFNYRVGRYRGHPAHFATYYNAAGQPVAQKVRWKEDGEKKFAWIGEPREAVLYGQNIWRDYGKRVVVTEGEIDALSVSQVQANRYPVVSLPNGARSAAADLARHVNWLEKFDEVVLLFDMDDAGQAAVQAAAPLFTPGKVKVARLPLKDASDMVKAGRAKELVDALWEAKAFRPDGIRSVSDLRVKAMEPAHWGLPWPWRTLTERTYGIQRSYMYGWGAGVGTGKTTLMKQIMLSAMRPDLIEPHDGLVDHLGNPIRIPEPRPIGTVLFEENPAKTLRSLAGMAMGKRINKPDVAYDPAELEREINALDGLFHPVDVFGAKDYDTIRGHIRYLVQGLGVKDIFLDPLTALVASADDERRTLDFIMADLSGLVETHDFTLHYVSHLTTPDGKPHEEGGRVLEKHFTGSRALARWTHAMLGLERNKQEHEPTTIRGLKDREFGEAVGPLLAVDFDRETGRMVEVPLGSKSPFKDETDPDL